MRTPFIRILHAGVDLADRWGPLMLGLSITDERGTEADKLTVDLDDREGRIAYPRTGASVQVEGGYREVGAVVQGAFVIDQVDLVGWPQVITLQGASVDARGPAKERRTEAYQPPEIATLGALCARMAARNGWTPRIAEALAAVPVAYEAQTEESDPAFLSRVVARYGGFVTIKQGNLVVAPRSGGRTVSGAAMPVATLRRGAGLLDYRVSWKDRAVHGRVRGRAFDRGRVEAVEVEAGDGDGTTQVEYRFREPFASADAAQAAASARAAGLARDEGSATFTLEGDPAIGAERPVEVVDVRAGVDGRWTPVRVEHRWGSDGYTTVVECETPGSGDTRGTGS